MLRRHCTILRVGDFPHTCCTPLAGWVFDCHGEVPAVSADAAGHILWGGWSWEELRLIWLWGHRN